MTKNAIIIIDKVDFDCMACCITTINGFSSWDGSILLDLTEPSGEYGHDLGYGFWVGWGTGPIR